MKEEALKLALEALEVYVKGYADRYKSLYPTIVTIKQALEQERALQALHDENERLGLYKDAYGQPEPEPLIDKSAAIRIATSLGWTPKREWQGLTDEERSELIDKYYFDDPSDAFMKEFEAKLKEKNHDPR